MNKKISTVVDTVVDDEKALFEHIMNMNKDEIQHLNSVLDIWFKMSAINDQYDLSFADFAQILKN